MLISLWSLDISLDQGLDTLLVSHKLQRGIGTRVNERVHEVRAHASKEDPQNKKVHADIPFLAFFLSFALSSCLPACLL